MQKNLQLSYLIDFYGAVLTEKQHDVIQQYYNDDLSLAEIAENFGITRQGVRDSIKRGEVILLELENKVGFAKKYGEMQNGLNELLKIVYEFEEKAKIEIVNSGDILQATQSMKAVIKELAD